VGGTVSTLLVLFELYRLALRALVALMGLHFAATTVGFFRRRSSAPPADPETWPSVTVQLPIRNEYYTASRLLEAVAAFDYPRDRLEIQVLDDSDDGTSEQLERLVGTLREVGLDIVHLRREGPTHYKAGALQAGLAQAKGELVAMFDADFVPAVDFLRRVVPYFADDKVALVQGAWAHENRGDSWFTRLQAQLLDALFLVEQTTKSRAGLPFQFNGTAGVWRRSAIDRAGGWTFDSLTEDLDLSIRVQLMGDRMVHLPELRVPSQLPTTLAAFRVQQRRWALGTAQLLRKRLFPVLRAKLPLRSRIAILTQLGRHLVHPLVMLMVITAPITTLYWVETPLEYGWLNAALLAFLCTTIALQHAVAARVAGQSAARAVLIAPLIVPLAIGLAPTYCVALFYGLRDRAGVFFRTPKVTRAPGESEPDYRPKRSLLILVEIAIGLAYVYFTTVALARGFLANGAFLGMVALAFLMLGFGSLRTRARVTSVRRSARRAIAQPAFAASAPPPVRTPSGGAVEALPTSVTATSVAVASLSVSRASSRTR
jgi:cellulose synthase/poly-beta-1,6-N-acetylglucosamine synthase-like glycosyltransferase